MPISLAPGFDGNICNTQGCPSDQHWAKRPRVEIQSLLNETSQVLGKEGFAPKTVNWVFPAQQTDTTSRQLADAVSYMGSILLENPQVDARTLLEKLSPISHEPIPKVV